VPAKERSSRVPAKERSSRVPAKERSSRVPAKERSSRVPADPTVRRSKEGGVDPNLEVRGKATEARSRLFDDADRTGQDSQEIVRYQRAGPPGPLLHR